uniref:Uncharacterized protein n=1 Tax=Populus trichocarpa TaxID=3694 RepID=A0A2K2C7Z1_POPTR
MSMSQVFSMFYFEFSCDDSWNRTILFLSPLYGSRKCDMANHIIITRNMKHSGHGMRFRKRVRTRLMHYVEDINFDKTQSN